jgi:hypothetical protein
VNPRDFISVEILVLVPLLWLLYRSARPWAISPIWLLLSGYLALAIAGRYSLDLCKGPLRALFILPESQLDDTLAYFLYVCIAFGVGTMAWILLVQPSMPAAHFSERSEHSEPGSLFILGTLVPLMLYVAGCGSALFYRTTYLAASIAPLKIAGSSLAPVGIALSGALCVSTSRRFLTVFALMTGIGYLLATFAMATRMMALVPLLFALGAVGARPDLAIARWMVAPGFVVSLVLLPVPLFLRSLPEQGLFPFVNALGKMQRSLQGRGLAGMILGNVLTGFPLTNFVGSVRELSTESLWTAINPLPGWMTDWKSIQPLLRVNFFTPYNGLGELLNHGYAVSGIFFVCIGIYFAHLEASIRTFAQRGRVLTALMMFGFPALFVLLTTQYNLRACVRLIYYSIAFEIAIHFIFSPRKNAQLSLQASRKPSGVTSAW